MESDWLPASMFLYQLCPVCDETLGEDAIRVAQNSSAQKVYVAYLGNFVNLAHFWF